MVVSGSQTATVTDTAYGQIATNADTSKVGATIEKQVAYTDTEAIVRKYFSDIPIMIQVARCESTFRHTLGDGSVLRGKVDNRDTGVMQINSFYHGKAARALGLDLHDLEDNMAYARHIYNEQGTQPWSASAPCWSRSLASL